MSRQRESRARYLDLVADMTSERVIQANRRNARASTGPRTAEGKTRSGRNARTHGLTARNKNLYDPAEVEHLAKSIAGELGDNPLILEAARSVAEAQTHLRRVQAIKQAISQDSAPVEEALANKIGSADPGLWANLLKRFESLERYERRAFSRRKMAIRHFYDLARRT